MFASREIGLAGFQTDGIEGARNGHTVAIHRAQLRVASARGYAEAEPLFTKVLETRRRVLGEEHFSTLVSMNYLADLYRIEGKDALAEELYAKVLEGRRRVLGPDHPDTTKVEGLLGQMRLQEKRYAEAEPLLLSAYQVLVKQAANLPQSSRSAVEQARERIVQLYQDWAKPEKAAEWREKIRQ
jgi:hypothetical protein